MEWEGRSVLNRSSCSPRACLSLSQLSRSSFEEAIRRGSQEKGWSHSLQLHRQERNLSYISQGQLAMCADRMQPLSRITDAFQVSEELEHKLQLIESSLNRVGMILVSVQGDVMQVNKAIKELSLEAEGVRQKTSLFDNSMHQLPRWEDDIIFSWSKHHFNFRSAD
ncbi:unnamed protein product [Musa hybrid cultivar]